MPPSLLVKQPCDLDLESHTLKTLNCRYGEKMGRMVRGVDSAYEELFAYACPKFITAAPPNLDAPTANTNQARWPTPL